MQMHLKLIPAALFENEGWFEEGESELKLMPVALAEDGWADATENQPTRRLMTDNHLAAMYPGDLVLYRCEGELVPAALVEPAADGGWVARDSRHGNGGFYLAAESIATRMPQRDFLIEEGL